MICQYPNKQNQTYQVFLLRYNNLAKNKAIPTNVIQAPKSGKSTIIPEPIPIMIAFMYFIVL